MAKLRSASSQEAELLLPSLNQSTATKTSASSDPMSSLSWLSLQSSCLQLQRQRQHQQPLYRSSTSSTGESGSASLSFSNSTFQALESKKFKPIRELNKSTSRGAKSNPRTRGATGRQRKRLLVPLLLPVSLSTLSLLLLLSLLQSSPPLIAGKSIIEGTYSSGQSINLTEFLSSDKSLLIEKSSTLLLSNPESLTPVQIASKSSTSLITTSTTTTIATPTSEPKTTIESRPAPKKGTETETETETGNESDQESAPEDLQNDSSAGDANDDAENCQGLSVGPSAEGKNFTDHERLVNLQSCLQRKVKRRILSATRSGLELFDKLSLSGGCTASLMNLMSNLGEIKSYAFKFVDASAKIPSGMMYGLLSDFGDFDQCLSIRSNPSVSLENEAEEGSYSGKYCLLSLKLNYHIELDENKTIPEGIIPDGVIWDELVRNYWTSDSLKGFQVGMCVPSRCTNDDLDQIFKHVSEGYNVLGEVMSCQDGRDIKAQQTADLLQLILIYSFCFILSLTLIGTTLDRYSNIGCQQTINSNSPTFKLLLVETLLCFSIIRNWRQFTQSDFSRCNLVKLAIANRETIEGAANRSSMSSSPSKSTSGQNTDSETYDSIVPSNKLSSFSQFSSTTPTSTESSRDNKLEQLSVDVDCHHNEKDESAKILKFNGQSARDTNYPLVHQQRQHHQQQQPPSEWLTHLAGMKMFIIIWITIGYSFLYPSANNYQYYRSIISMNMTKDSVWFATTNFTLGIDMLLYITGLTFVVKLLHQSGSCRFLEIHHKTMESSHRSLLQTLNRVSISRLLLRKVLRFWPAYTSVIAIAILVPLISDGPMWPEMVNRRLGKSCRNNWWANLMMVNNFLPQSDVCLPSSWFLSVLMQSFILGSIILLACRGFGSLKVTICGLLALLFASMGASFALAYLDQVGAPVIKMDESFVLDLDEKIFRLYTNLFNNLGPFLVGMIGGFILLDAKRRQWRQESVLILSKNRSKSNSNKWSNMIGDMLVGLAVLVVAILVLSSVFHTNYTRFWASIYWSSHRVGWAIVTGYIIHQCSTGRWKLLRDFLSLSTFIPLSKLIFIAYLVYPIFIHMHSGLVRDGLHVSIYNMLNIYTTRLVMTFATSAAIHLLVVSPFCSLEELYLGRWTMSKCKINEGFSDRMKQTPKIFDETRTLPLLEVAPVITTFNDKVRDQNDVDEAGPEVASTH